ncbi:hypothetical protein [Anaeromicropila herbilytica]|uniref:Uncharacterized protein n=1 Tax=Anaeromicropila herbilytica TaxID=2785025 RepID=A0A7R7EJR8_9FIRM|nr:hypothetical protein [Anaeromicropila herbilytica]BCN30131.1 hypothetical protein bsdtb5_14260 [Anaeromicropila herbilytica]
MKVNTDTLTYSTKDLHTIYNEFLKLEESLSSVRISISYNFSIKQQIDAQLEEVDNMMTIIENGILKMEESLKTASKMYQYNENNIVDYYLMLDQMVKAAEKGYPLTFDPNNEYGGDQGSPKNTYSNGDKTLEDIIKKYYPNLTNTQIRDYLDKLNSEGCGYVALVNTLFKQYEGKEDEFEKNFGFPMYSIDSSGKKHLNFDYVVADFYASEDNHNDKNFLFIHWDEKDDSEDKYNEKTKVVEGNGTTSEDREYRWERYLENHNIKGKVEDVKITIDNYDKYSKKGDVVIAIRPVQLENEFGETVVNDKTNGHAMTVTGVTKDGRYIVSSWGEKYYVNPDKIENQKDSYFDFQLVSYK